MSDKDKQEFLEEMRQDMLEEDYRDGRIEVLYRKDFQYLLDNHPDVLAYKEARDKLNNTLINLGWFTDNKELDKEYL